MSVMARTTRTTGGLALAAMAAVLGLAGCAMDGQQQTERNPVFYPLPPDPPRVQFLTAINTSRDVVAERGGLAALVLGTRDELTGRDVLQQPHGLATWQGKLYVCDRVGAAVKVFDLENQDFYVLGGKRNIMAAPTNMGVDARGFKFVVESMRQIIHVFDPQDEYVTSYKVSDGRPADVAVVGNELFVPDVTGDRILVLDRSSGKVLRTLGGKGHDPGQFLMPNAIARDSEGNLYVSDQMNYRVQKIDRDGKVLLTFGEAGDSYGHFARPRGVAVGPDGVIYVVETIFEIVQMFNQQGQVLMGFGNFRGEPGFLVAPAGIAADASSLPYFKKYVDPRFEPEYLLFVASTMGKARVGVYAFGRWKAGAEAPQLIEENAGPTTAPSDQDGT